MRNVLFALIIFATLVSCSHNVREELNETVVKYNDLVRWHELEAASMFAPDQLREDFISRAKTAKNMRVIDYRVANVRFDEKLNKASVDVVIDYYPFTTNKVKSIRDTEEWAYMDEKGVKSWRLMSPLPELK